MAFIIRMTMNERRGIFISFVSDKVAGTEEAVAR